MRIAYIGQMADVSGENGISKKIAAQAREWIANGHAVRYFSLVTATNSWSGLQPLDTHLVARGNALLRPLRSLALTRHIREWGPSIIYFRYGYHSAGFPRLFRDIPTVAEINSDDLSEYPLTLSGAKLHYHRLTRERLLASVTGFVHVTQELQQRFARFNKPDVVIANGISLRDFQPALPCHATAPFRLVFIGSRNTPWHGLERVVEFAAMFPDARFDVIGTEPLRAGANVTFHGELPRRKYESLLASSTAAIATLARYKTRMDEGCPLKVREYLAMGLPVIGAYQDTDIPEGADYFLRLPNDSNSLTPHRAKIESWLQSWRHRRVARDSIAHLDYPVKERLRLAFLERMLDP